MNKGITKPMIIMLTIVGIVMGCIIGYKEFSSYMMRKYILAGGFPPQTVSTIKASMQEWQPMLVATGSLRAVNGADLSSEVSGIVETVNFDSGSDVEKDTLLVQLRAEDDIAKLHSLESNEKIADINYQRDLKQIKTQAISQATVDNDSAILDSAKAQTAAQQAIVDKKTVRAPFAGHVGIRQVDVGQYLNPGAVIVTLQQLDPIYVDFSLPEQDLTHIALGQKVTAKVDALPDTPFEGQVTAVNSKVDEATRNVQVRATFKNPDHKLLPGMFANVTVSVDQPVKYITVPQTAIQYNTYGNTVYLAKNKEGKDDKDDKKQLVAEQSVVVTGETRGDQVAVLSGIKEGDEVVTTGQIKLRNDTPIIVNNDVQPANDANPTPHEQ
jgi:membrane fusion protein, multidrug efflux system